MFFYLSLSFSRRALFFLISSVVPHYESLYPPQHLYIIFMLTKLTVFFQFNLISIRFEPNYEISYTFLMRLAGHFEIIISYFWMTFRSLTFSAPTRTREQSFGYSCKKIQSYYISCTSNRAIFIFR